ncbi:V-type ATP synthase subunit D [Dysosmobacter sp.]
MANITVSPTRMELTRLKGKLRTAQRGHKLLKDKRDELMKQFLDTVREVRSLRAEVEEELMTVHKSFTVASALMSSESLEQALLYPKQSVELTQTSQNIMSVNVPIYHFQTRTKSDSDIYPYGFAATSGELDTAVDALGKVFQKMLKLAQIEKSAQLMAEEIEKTRRRVNALEYVMIPNTQEAIRYITMKLDENDRATTTRLMKVKDMLLQEAIEEQRERDARAMEAFAAKEQEPQAT